MMSWASSGGDSPRQSTTVATIRLDLVAEGVAHLLRREDHRLRQAGGDLPAPHLGLDLVGVGEGRADGQLELLAGALADGDAVLVADVVLDGGVHVEAAAADGPGGDHPAQGDDRRLGGAAAHVDHHVAHRLVDGQPGTDGRRHGLLDEVGGRGAGPAGGLLDRPALHRGDGRRHADQHPGPVELGDPGPPEQQPDHPLGDVEVGDGPLAQGPDGHDVARGSARSSSTPRCPRPGPRGSGC